MMEYIKITMVTLNNFTANKLHHTSLRLLAKNTSGAICCYTWHKSTNNNRK